MAVKTMALVAGKLAETPPQEESHWMPLGELVTVPWPDLPKATSRVLGVAAKLALTLRATSMLTVQVLVLPAQAPPQPVKAPPPEAAAVNVTLLLALKLLEQVVPQSMPAGWLVTTPPPDLVTVKA